ncbi:hypothetical protein D3P44_013805 [Stutzerimonas balearica]|uniref:DUF6701 domain-containing protein n=1 Tax=Stutzerimonas balearica TaxID=74829 RepID=UPI001BB1CF21|nr:DUF6701 domain-containing protein [Stutzerimonas balearica]WAN08490.1 hypothetical protein D3P44_013805 [Stutzerimonas balearica]
MTVTMPVMRYMALAAFVLLCSVSAEAATYNLSNGQYPPCSSKSWTVSGTTYTCNYGRITLKAGDTVVASTQATLWAESGFTIQASTIGSVGNGMVLRASYGDIQISGSSNTKSVVYGSIIGANVELGDTTVKGDVTGSGNAKMVRSSIDGNVDFSNEITLVDTTVNGFVSSANREINLTEGRIGGNITSSGGRGVFIDGTAVEGNISSANTILISSASITGNVASSCCKITVNSSSIVGNISAPGNPIELNDSDVVGTVSNTNRIYLNDSIVYGDVLAATGWGSDVTIQGTGSSRIFGQCAYSGLSPTSLCSDSADINETLPLYLRFDEASWRNATVQNSGTLNITGVASGAAETAGAIPALPGTWGTCRYGEFSGSGRISVPHHSTLSFNDKLSVSFWLNVSELPASGSVILLGKGDNYRLELNATGRLVLTTRMFGLFSSRELAVATGIADGWNHVGFTLEFQSLFVLLPTVDIKLYVNGELKDSKSETLLIGLGLSTNSDDVIIGGGGGKGLRGLIDEVRLDRTIWGATEFSRQARARHWCGSSLAIDHFEFVTGGGAHTCSPHTITLKACTNAAPAACQLYPGTVSVTLTGNGWVGGSNKSLVNGIGTFQLQGLQIQMPLGLSASLPVSTNQTLCQIGGASLSSACVLNFSQSGFIFDVPNMLANQGVHKIPIKAVIDRGNPGSPRCEPAFTDEDVPRNIKFWSEFISPAGGELADSSEAVWLNGEAVAQSFAAAEPLPLYFNGDGISHIDVNYREAGKMQLNAHYAGSGNEGDSGVMIGSDDFVSAPAGFCITPEESCSSGDSNCPAFRQVGQPFEVTIRPVAWNAGDNICAGMTTRNYRQNDLKLEPVLVAPAASANSGEVLVPATRSYDHTTLGSAAAWNGEITQNVAFSEVGVFRLQVAPPIDAYFGVTVPSSASEPIGRFYPTHLKVEGEGALTAGCGVFSYQDQPIDIATPLTLTITGYGRVDGGGEYITENYDYDGFWKFEDRPAEVWTAADRELDLSDRLSLDDDGVTERGQNDRDGKRTYTWDAKRLSYTRSALPTAGDLPFSIRQRFSAAELTDKDGVCYDLGTSCQAFEQTIADSEIRLGRLRIANAHGSEQLPLALPWMIESWQVPGVFLPEEGDICSASDWSEPDLIEPTGDLAAIPAPKVSTIKAGHQGVLTVAAPEVTGSGRVGFPKVPKWLWYDWRGEGREPSRGLATFGIYQGPKPLIFRREVYR